MTAVLFFMSCATSRKQTETTRTESSAADMDSVGSLRTGLVAAGIPKSELTLKIPVPELLSLPPGASYHGKSGQAGVDVKTEGDTLLVTSTCDSLQRLVLWYEEELTRIRSRTQENVEIARTEIKRRFNPVKIALIAFIAGMASGIVLTIVIKRRNGKE